MQEFTVQLFDDGSAQISGTGANLELRFGYSKNAHMYSVKFIRSKEWEDLYIRVHFHPEADIYDVEPVLAQNNIVNIPAMVTSMPGEGKLTIEGTDGYKIITSADIPYRVSENSGIDSESDPEPGESSFQQFVDEVKKDAEEAKQAAKDAESALTETKEASASALTDIEKAKGNAISELEKIETEVKGEIQEDVDSAKSSAEASSKSAEEAKTAADSAKKSLSDLETVKQSAISEISKEKDNSVSVIGSAKEAALNEISTSGNSAIQNVKIAETNAINSVETEGSTQKTALNNASNAALTSIDTAKTNAVKAVEDKASEVIQDIQNAGDSELSAISEATSSAIEQITQSAGQHLTQIDSATDEAVTDIMNAKEDSLEEIEGVNAHPPIQNPETGKWQIWNAETSSYVDTVYDWEGGYYSPSVDSEGNLTWEGSKEGMEDIPSANIRGPQGLGVPTSTANDYGKAPTVNASGTAYELAGPYAPLSAAIRPTASGNPVSITDSVEWPLLGLKVYGKSTQDGTPSPESPVPIVSAGDGGSVELSVTGANLLNLNDGNYDSGSGFTAVVKDGIINVEKANASNPNGAGVSRLYFQPGNFCLSASCDFANNASIFVLSLPNYEIIAKNTLTSGKRTYVAFNMPSPMFCAITISPLQVAEIEADNVAIQVEHGSVPTAYAPYVSQSLTLSTPNGLPGIPVDSGGNYTDTEGQQWVCDEIDLRRDVYVKRILKQVLNGSEEWLTWGVDFTTSGITGFFWYNKKENDPEANYIDKDAMGLLCNILEYMDDNYAGKNVGISYSPASSITQYIKVGISNDFLSDISSSEAVVNSFKQLLQETNMIVYAPLLTPIETPLSEEEITAYKALHTYDGATVVSTAEDVAGLEVRYVADAQKYIDNRLTAIESRLNALEISEASEGE